MAPSDHTPPPQRHTYIEQHFSSLEELKNIDVTHPCDLVVIKLAHELAKSMRFKGSMAGNVRSTVGPVIFTLSLKLEANPDFTEGGV
ncbi:hypothetical protein [Geminisphaera colitermitum]|uniref:hypothetical protein n=1 Tax=Geminisphaera colitermitum TaxID=1148786 RepID=UPI000158D587|nr:hypothetical protein [Geminisphaera colitermitum]